MNTPKRRGLEPVRLPGTYMGRIHLEMGKSSSPETKGAAGQIIEW
jgi:hypothetical protein